jgi:hypothetical protein
MAIDEVNTRFKHFMHRHAGDESGKPPMKQAAGFEMP